MYAKAGGEEGEVWDGPRFLDLHFQFADTIATHLFFAAADPNKWDKEFARFITQLREVVLPLTRFMQAVLTAHLNQHREALKWEAATWPPP